MRLHREEERYMKPRLLHLVGSGAPERHVLLLNKDLGSLFLQERIRISVVEIIWDPGNMLDPEVQNLAYEPWSRIEWCDCEMRNLGVTIE